MHAFTDDVWDAFGATSKSVLDGFMDDELFAKIRTSVDKSMAATAGWVSLSDGTYTAQRARVTGA